MNKFTLITTFSLKLDVIGVKLKFYVKFYGVVFNFKERMIKFKKIINYNGYFYN